MDLQARKLNFIQEFLRINDEGLIDRLEQFLLSEQKKKVELDLKPMSLDEFNKMVDQSEKDFASSKVNEARELLKKTDSWK